MKNVVIGLFLVFTLSGCSVLDEIPSFWDDNEAKQVIDIYVAVDQLNCESTLAAAQLSRIRREVEWLKQYSRLKKSKDVGSVINEFDKTLTGITSKSSFSTNYCVTKRDTMLKQINRIAEGIMGRY
jgi:hypothetical protein